jgi:hypothetical protein
MSWMVIMTNRMQETLVMSHLPRGEYEVYRPMLGVLRKDRRTGLEAVEPRAMWPGYIFARRLSPMKRAVTGLPGVKALLTQEVDDGLIEALKVREIDGLIGLIRKDKQTAAPKVGQDYTTADGMISGVICEVISENRVAILSTFLGAQRRMTVDLK